MRAERSEARVKRYNSWPSTQMLMIQRAYFVSLVMLNVCAMQQLSVLSTTVIFISDVGREYAHDAVDAYVK